MAKIRIGGLGQLLLIVVAAVLTLTVADGAYGERAAPTSARGGAGSRSAAPVARTTAPVAAPMASGASDDAESTSDDTESTSDPCPVRRCSRSTAEPARSGTLVSAAEWAEADSGPGITAPLTGRQAVPLSRSGELPVRHGVFRC
ncbi:hypothetical protein SSP35_09_02130 [Streptomyces sp. NBRC 110611]|nr:hypothetical protein SSP35_09_02130 [Streptomyces sp. NBRC 110611]